MTPAQDALRLELELQLNDVHEYLDLAAEKSCLDGWFTAEELRRIATLMDKLAELK